MNQSKVERNLLLTRDGCKFEVDLNQKLAFSRDSYNTPNPVHSVIISESKICGND